MRLTHAHITNYKSVEDSNEFSVGNVTCLVGKNEAGKTAILQALHTLNPESGAHLFEASKSYPRRFWSEYEEREEEAEAVVLKTKWEIDEKEITGLHKIVGPESLTGTTVVVSKSYEQSNTNWTVPIDEAKTIAFLIQSSALHAEEKDALASNKSVKALKAALEAFGAAITDRQKSLLAFINLHYKRETAATAVIDYLNLPKFFYFSSYDRMSGQVALEQLMQKQSAGTLDKSDEVFLAFLSLEKRYSHFKVL